MIFESGVISKLFGVLINVSSFFVYPCGWNCVCLDSIMNSTKQMRANYYVLQTTFYHDEKSIYRGNVAVLDNTGNELKPSTPEHIERLRKWIPMYFSFPSNIVSCHYCVQPNNGRSPASSIMGPWIKFVLSLFPKKIRLRMRFHFGVYP